MKKSRKERREEARKEVEKITESWKVYCSSCKYFQDAPWYINTKCLAPVLHDDWHSRGHPTSVNPWEANSMRNCEKYEKG